MKKYCSLIVLCSFAIILACTSIAAAGGFGGGSGGGGGGSGDALVANPLSQFASTTSAQLATTLSNETGSSLAVFNTSPILVAPILGVAGATSLALTGTAGAGFSEHPTQSSAPTAPATGYRDYADATGRRSWIRASDGFTRTWDATLTANRVYTLPDQSVTIAGLDFAQTWTGIQTYGAGKLVADSPAFTTLAATTRDAIGVTSADGWALENTTAAAVGAQQFSPRFRLRGQGWKTTATAASQRTDWTIENQPVQGTTNPTSNLVFANSINAGAYASLFTLTSAGQALHGDGTSTLPSMSFISEPGTGFYRSGSGVMNYVNNGTRLVVMSSTLWGALTGFQYGWYSASFAAFDTALGRNGAGIVEINNGSAGTFRDLKLRNLVPGASLSTSMTDGFVNLPGAAGTPSGTPANTTGFPAYYDSTNQKICVYSGSWRCTGALS